MDLLSHQDDPQTSRDAAARAGLRAKGHAALIYSMLHESVGQTASQLAGLLTAHRDFERDEYARLCQVRRRLSDLRSLGLAQRHGSRDGESLWVSAC